MLQTMKINVQDVDIVAEIEHLSVKILVKEGECNNR